MLSFYYSVGDLNVLRRGADIAVLMTATDADVCGVGKVDSIESGNTLAVIKKKCAVGYYSFGHEVLFYSNFFILVILEKQNIIQW
jgi:hypothetical protein